MIRYSNDVRIILEWHLKDHVTLKTELMDAENSALPSNYILKYIIVEYQM